MKPKCKYCRREIDRWLEKERNYFLEKMKEGKKENWAVLFHPYIMFTPASRRVFPGLLIWDVDSKHNAVRYRQIVGL